MIEQMEYSEYNDRASELMPFGDMPYGSRCEMVDERMYMMPFIET